MMQVREMPLPPLSLKGWYDPLDDEAGKAGMLGRGLIVESESPPAPDKTTGNAGSGQPERKGEIMSGDTDLPNGFTDAARARCWLQPRVKPRIESLHTCHVKWIAATAANTAIQRSTSDDPTNRQGHQLSLIRQDVQVVRGWALREGLPDVPKAPRILGS